MLCGVSTVSDKSLVEDCSCCQRLLLSLNWTVSALIADLFHWTCHFCVVLHLFVYISFFYLKASPYLTFNMKQGCGTLIHATFSVFWWWEVGHWKQIPLVYVGLFKVDGPHWPCHWQMWHVLSGSTLLCLPVATWRHCPKWALCFLHFPGLSQSGT